MNIQLRRQLFFAFITIELLFLVTTHYRGISIPLIYSLGFPLFLLMSLLPFPFFPEHIKIADGRVLYCLNKKVMSTSKLAGIEEITYHAFWGLFARLELRGPVSSRVISLKSRGAEDIWKHIPDHVTNKQAVITSLQLQNDLNREDLRIDTLLIVAVKWYYLFAFITPLLIWDTPSYYPIYWMILTLVYIMFVSVILKVVNRIVLFSSQGWGNRNLALVHHWSLFLAFLIYLIKGISL